MGRLFERVLAGLCAAVVVGAVLVMASRLAAYQTYVVRGGSMAPAIPQGSLVFVQPVPARDLKVGDVVTYRRPEQPGQVITHRIVSVRPLDAAGTNGLVIRTRGDANDIPDPWEVQLLGTAWRVVVGVPLLGTVFDMLGTAAGRVVFLAVPAGALVALGAVRLWRGRRTRRNASHHVTEVA